MAQGYLVNPPLSIDEFEVFRHNISKCRGVPIGLVHMAIVDHVQWRRQMVIRRFDRFGDDVQAKLVAEPDR